jgi:four helix bundle protein
VERGKTMDDKDLKIFDRSYQFALRIIKMGEQFPDTTGAKIIGNQLLRAGTSVAANVEEAVAAYSKPDFIYKMSIAPKEARETHYWLRLLRDSETLKPARLQAILLEAGEIKNILGAIVRTARKRSR